MWLATVLAGAPPATAAKLWKSWTTHRRAATGADSPRSHVQAHAAHAGHARRPRPPAAAAGTRRNLVRGRLHLSIRRAGDRAAVSVGRGAGARHLRPLASGPWRGTRKSRSKSKSGRPEGRPLRGVRSLQRVHLAEVWRFACQPAFRHLVQITGLGLLTSRNTAASIATPISTMRGSSGVPCRASPSSGNHIFQSGAYSSRIC